MLQFEVNDSLIQLHRDDITSLGFTPDGRYIVSGGRDNIINQLDRKSGIPVCSCVGHKSAVTSVAYLLDGLYIVTGSEDYTIKIWDVSKER